MLTVTVSDLLILLPSDVRDQGLETSLKSKARLGQHMSRP